MLVKFFHRGTANSDSALAYLLSEDPLRYLAGARDRKGVVRNPPPAVVKGNRELTRKLINQCRNKHRYVSGVLSFERLIATDKEAEIIGKFEGVAFAGLRADQYDCLWIRHAHLGRTELHFLVPRTELTTLKALNINPPRQRKEGMYDAFRKIVNHDYGLRDPSGVMLSPAERGRLENKLNSLVAARATYNRARYPVPAGDRVLPPLTYEDRTGPVDGGLAAARCAVPGARPSTGRAVECLGRATRTFSEACGRFEQLRVEGGRFADQFPGPAIERLERATRTVGRASEALERSGDELGRATQEFSARVAVRAASSALFNHYQIPEPISRDAAPDLDRDDFDRDRDDEP